MDSKMSYFYFLVFCTSLIISTNPGFPAYGLAATKPMFFSI